MNADNEPLSRDEEKKYCLDKQDKRSIISYQLHNGISTLARVATSVAVYILVSPVGVLYHTSQALYNRNIQDIRNRHLSCAKTELLRTATLASVVYIGRFPTIFSNRLYGQFATIPLFMAAMDLASTAFKPIYNSRYLDSNSLPGNSDADWRAQMALKWELGIQVENMAHAGRLLRDLIPAYSNAILQTISELQEKLPPDHRLPYDLEVNVQRILRYLEQSREELTSSQWKEIRPLRDQLARYNTIMPRLQEYLNFETCADIVFGTAKFPFSTPNHQRLAENAFTINGQIPAVTERPLRQLRIHSLTQGLFKRMLSSDLFYPSNYHPQKLEDKGSIAHTMRELDPYENRRAVTTRTHSIFKPLRFTARALASVGIIGVGCTVGTVYHGTQTLRYLTSYAVGSSDAKFGNWERVKAHVKATFDDATSICGMLFLPLFNDLSGIATRADRAGLHKAITLKNMFGVTEATGKLLSYSYDDDVRPKFYFDSCFTHLHQMRSTTLWHKLKLIHDTMGDKSKLLMNSAFGEFTRTGNFSEVMVQMNNANIPANKQEECRQIFNDLVELRSIILEALKVTEQDLDKTLKMKDVKYPYYAYVFNQTTGFGAAAGQGTSAASANDPWLGILTKAQECITQNNAGTMTENADYCAFKLRVMNTAATARSVLGFTEDQNITKGDLNKAYRKLSLLVHPDKLQGKSAELRKEGEELFKLLDNAKTALAAKL